MVKKRNSEIKDEGSSTESNEDVRNHSTSGDPCKHVNPAVRPTIVNKVLKSSGLEKECEMCIKNDQKFKPVMVGDTSLEENDVQEKPDLTLWMCLRCGSQLCGKAHNKHALQHATTPRSDSHVIVVNTTTHLIWCYKCNTEINSNGKIADCIDAIKRQVNKDVSHQLVSDIEKKMCIGNDESAKLDTMTTSAASTVTTVCKATDLETQTRSKNAIPISKQVIPLPAPAQYRDINFSASKNIFISGGVVDGLPRVRGLTNLGNTCFFNAVLQCLARTPYLLEVLQETKQEGENFQLPGGLLKLPDGTEENIEPISGTLKEWRPLTEAFAETLSELQSGASGVFSPSKLLKLLTSKWPQFAGADQHDSHELLRHLLEGVRNEDMRRYQEVILIKTGYSTHVNPDSVDAKVKAKIKFYGNQISNRMLLPERVFRGFIVSTLTCGDCNHISPRQESFLDISLPVNAEKPQPPVRRKASPEPDYSYRPAGSTGTKPLSNKDRRQAKRAQKAAAKREKNLFNSNATPAETNVVIDGGGDAESGGDDDGMSDADVEDNLTDDSQPKKGSGTNVDQNGNQAGAVAIAAVTSPEKRDDSPENPDKEGPGENNVYGKFEISHEGAEKLRKKQSIHSDHPHRDQDSKSHRQRTNSRSDWSSTLAPRYQCEDNECSIQSCFNAFTAIEMMTGNNKVCCDECKVKTNSTKQFLVSSPPAVLILHLKRFQVGPRGMLRKMTKTVTFPAILDIAPFCRARVKLSPTVKRDQKKLLYSLYGVVEHSGTMHGGHYVAYVKVRPQLKRDDPRWEFLPKGTKAELDQEDEQALQTEREIAKQRARQMHHTGDCDSDDIPSSSESSDRSSRSSAGPTSDGEEEGAVGYTPQPEIQPDVDPPPGKWYYVSDSHVRETSEAHVLDAQAYLLFYERIY